MDVLAVTETWLTDDAADAIHVPGYRFVFKCRSSGLGGGVGLFVKDHYDLKILQPAVGGDSSTEVILVELCCSSNNNKSIIVGSVYRPPGSNPEVFNVTLSSMLADLKRGKHNTFIAGDFNLDLLKSATHLGTQKVLDTFASYQMLPTIRKPTRVTSYSATLIDNIYTNCMSQCKSSVIICTDISDHMPVLTTCTLHTVKKLIINTSTKD